ncbi:LytTR family DNA-binding domain-containing protein [Metaclostridioides mangenotii]|uniref:LytR/AlgR family response regulator transcription factor n=1 Tax=Metaclostridioides mangenotii TaxID=1540 RepID=UPI0028EFDF39|nr:LytTR family DNA-binding domain-containing protein [Clostridioides mangenotii]
MYRLVICEDDLTQRDHLKKDIDKIFGEVSSQYEIYEYSSGEELIEAYTDGIDIYFLDIHMDELTGMDTARKLREKNDKSEIIFITSLVDYVQEGYEVRAYRYLLKPIKFDELKEHILSCLDDIVKRQDNFMVIENKGNLVKILIDDILYIEVIKREITIHTDDMVFLTKNSMKNIEKELGRYEFFRCHKSFLINIKKVEGINKESVKIGEDIVPVSKHRLCEFRRLITLKLGDIIC